MLLCDIVFPQNIPPLTYRVPDELKDNLRVGQTVVAPLRRKPKRALLWRLYEAEPVRDLEEIISVEERIPPLNKSLLRLIQWSARYYLCNEGQVLRVAQFEHYGPGPKRSRPPKLKHQGPSSLPIPEPVALPRRGVTLFRVSSLKEEMALASKLVFEVVNNTTQSVLVLCPERHETEEVYSLFKETLSGQQVGLYHGMLTYAQKARTIEAILNGRTRVLVGTKSAVFLPLKHLGLIIVLKEHSRQYKQEEVPKLNARDIAVKRGQIEQVPVVLTSATPSTETSLNVMLKKYGYKEGNTSLWRPTVRLVRRTKGLLSASVLSDMRAFLRQGGAVLVVEHRLGYGLIQCKDCQHLLRCPHCSRPMTYHRQGPKGPVVSCHFCALSERAPESCPACGGFSLEPIGHGLERAVEELRAHLGEVHVLKDETAVLEPSALYLGTLRSYSIIATTKVLLVLLNPDLFINFPELRPAERLFQDLHYIATQLPQGSRLVLQTAQPKEPFYRFLRRWDYLGFVKNELHFRKTMGLPPFKRIVSIMVHIKTDKDITEAAQIIKRHLSGLSLQGPLVLGSPQKGYKRMIKYLFHCPDKRGLKQKLEVVEKDLSGLKALLRVDVDPYEP